MFSFSSVDLFILVLVSFVLQIKTIVIQLVKSKIIYFAIMKTRKQLCIYRQSCRINLMNNDPMWLGGDSAQTRVKSIVAKKDSIQSVSMII